MYTFKKDGILIRTMNVNDVSAYVARFEFKDLNYRKQMILKSKQVLKSLGEEPKDMYFVVIKKGVIIGAIVAKGYLDSVTDAVIEVDVPNASIEEIRQIKEIFVEFVKDTWIYDSISFISQSKKIGKRIPISYADTESSKTPK